MKDDAIGGLIWCLVGLMVAVSLYEDFELLRLIDPNLRTASILFYLASDPNFLAVKMLDGIGDARLFELGQSGLEDHHGEILIVAKVGLRVEEAHRRIAASGQANSKGDGARFPHVLACRLRLDLPGRVGGRFVGPDGLEEAANDAGQHGRGDDPIRHSCKQGLHSEVPRVSVGSDIIKATPRPRQTTAC